MSNSKKYDFRVIQKKTTWTAQITRKASNTKTVISKKKTGFKTEEEAISWAKSELVLFLENHVERNKEKAKNRADRNEKEAEMQKQQEIYKKEQDRQKEQAKVDAKMRKDEVDGDLGE